MLDLFNSAKTSYRDVEAHIEKTAKYIKDLGSEDKAQDYLIKLAEQLGLTVAINTSNEFATRFTVAKRSASTPSRP